MTQKEIIRKIANKKGMKDSSLLEEFIAIRFPTEMNESYIGEWVDRFMSGNPISYMDSLSRLAFLNACKRLIGR